MNENNHRTTLLQQSIGILLGLLLLIAMHILAWGFIGFITPQRTYSDLSTIILVLVTFFIWQLLYVIPAVIFFYRRGNRAVSKGIIIGAVITALLNGTCSLLVLS